MLLTDASFDEGKQRARTKRLCDCAFPIVAINMHIKAWRRTEKADDKSVTDVRWPVDAWRSTPARNKMPARRLNRAVSRYLHRARRDVTHRRPIWIRAASVERPSRSSVFYWRLPACAPALPLAVSFIPRVLCAQRARARDARWLTFYDYD